MYSQEQRRYSILSQISGEPTEMEITMQKAPRRAAANKESLHIISLLLMLIMLSQTTFASLTTPSDLHTLGHSFSSRATNETAPLECVQVASPVQSPTGACQQTLMIHTFAYSYGQPFIGKSQTSHSAARLEIYSQHACSNRASY